MMNHHSLRVSSILPAAILGLSLPFVLFSRSTPVETAPVIVPSREVRENPPLQLIPKGTVRIDRKDGRYERIMQFVLTPPEEMDWEDLPEIHGANGLSVHKVSLPVGKLAAPKVPAAPKMTVSGLRKSSGSHRKARISIKVPKVTVKVSSGSAATQRSIMRGTK